jgi:hypothetical protein
VSGQGLWRRRIRGLAPQPRRPPAHALRARTAEGGGGGSSPEAEGAGRRDGAGCPKGGWCKLSSR